MRRGGRGTSRRGEVHLWWSAHMHGATWDVLGIWARQKGGQTCGGAGRMSGWGLSRGALFQRVVGGPVDVDVDVDVDARAAQHVCGVRARWVRISGAGNMVVGLERARWGHSECAGSRVVQTCWGG